MAAELIMIVEDNDQNRQLGFEYLSRWIGTSDIYSAVHSQFDVRVVRDRRSPRNLRSAALPAPSDRTTAQSPHRDSGLQLPTLELLSSRPEVAKMVNGHPCR